MSTQRALVGIVAQLYACIYVGMKESKKERWMLDFNVDGL